MIIKFMHRVFILLLIATGFLVFAADSQSILQARTIGDTSVSVQWTPIAGATKYKVSYDDSSLLTQV